MKRPLLLEAYVTATLTINPIFPKEVNRVKRLIISLLTVHWMLLWS